METVVIKSGSRFEIRAIGAPDDCEFEDFLDQLGKTNEATFNKLIRRLDHCADRGIPTNVEMCKSLKGPGELWELKANQVRVLWFLHGNRIIVISHAFIKKKDKTPSSELDRARRRRSEYFAQQ